MSYIDGWQRTAGAPSRAADRSRRVTTLFLCRR
jgi:hypothetical protein